MHYLPTTDSIREVLLQEEDIRQMRATNWA